MRRVGSAGSAGFTLLEMILALTMLAMLVGMAFSAFAVGHRSVTTGEAAAELHQRLRMAEDVFGRQVRSAVYYFARVDDDSLPYFFGRPDGVTFVSAAPQGRGGSGLAVITYQVVESQLVIEERVIFTPDDLYDPPPGVSVQRAVLLDGFSSLRFDYLPHDEVEIEWQPTWDAREEDTLPAAVRMSVDGLALFRGVPWMHAAPVMTIAYGWGGDEFRDPPDEFDEDELDEFDEDDDDDFDDEDDDGDTP